KAGVYLVVRLAPAFDGTFLTTAVAITGAFTFLAAAVLAAGQSNAKRVLAYSTISNLGLIIACAGLNTALAISAAILLILFHAVSKGLLFLSVGVIEHRIGSRDIEDMEGLVQRMPVTAIVTLVGIFSMLLPPFGVLVAKWAAIEAAAQLPLALLLFAAGSAFTVLFWTKWMGKIVSSVPGAGGLHSEGLPFLYAVPLIGLGSLAVVLTALIGFVSSFLVAPAVAEWYPTSGLAQSGPNLVSAVGSFPVWPLLIVLAVVVAVAILASPVRRQDVHSAYLCGEQMPEVGDASFRSIADEPQQLSLHSYYFESLLGESRITKWANPIAIVLLVALVGVAYL
ncbi:MAG: proton-conducting transporter membrane subunit, partial [Dehalococcoidales bacterium]|nr:proton-conducting transporter membrane subunit [Dehalococcoidales bacterium]